MSCIVVWQIIEKAYTNNNQKPLEYLIYVKNTYNNLKHKHIQVKSDVE